METVEISNRGDFVLWAIHRAQAIVAAGGAALAMAARDMNKEALAETAAALGKAISDAMLVRWPARRITSRLRRSEGRRFLTNILI